jgi:tetratricopeptide (TPR) repeat protein
LYELRWRRDKTGSDYVAAIEAYQRAEEFFPSNPDTALNLGRLYDLKGRHKLALGKYLRARVNSEEQYHVRRKIRRRDKKELEERIEVLKPAVTDGTAVPPLNFTQPRLLGWPNFTPPPERKAPGGSDKGSKGAAGQGA